ncbi:MAG: hydrogen gas-evolving membrane-bound hydrogenase subunit E [Marinilabiliaceae bacterium]
MEHFSIILIGIIFLAGLGVPLLKPLFKSYLGRILALIPFLLFGVLAILFFTLPKETAVIIDPIFSILPEMAFAFRIDGLSLIFGLMVSGIGGLVLGYSSFYMAGSTGRIRFFSYLTLFMGAMLGLVFSDNLLILFIFWEMTSILSFLLIGFDHHLEKSRQAAFQALLLTALGGVCLFFAVIMVGDIAGTYQLSELYDMGFHLGANSNYPLVFLLVFVAITTKSAQFPFHFWLPGAMQAPTPISAYLHSATMVTAGIFLMLRLNPILGGTLMWKGAFILTGGITMFIGAFFSLGQRDLKRILAFTTISALGTMVLLAGINTPESILAALLFFIVHGLYKGGLFMATGIIDKNTGIRDIHQLGSLMKKMPLTTFGAVLALLSMAGLPPMLGFIGKELIYDAAMQVPGLDWVIVPLGVAANMMMVAISISVFIEVFMPLKAMPGVPLKHPEKMLPRNFILAPVVLALFGLGLGLAPEWLEKSIANALHFVQSRNIDVDLSVWHGFNKVLLLSIFTVAMGVVIYLFKRPVNRLVNKVIAVSDQYHLPQVFNNLINRYLKLAGRNTDRIQHGYHRYYLITFFVMAFLLVIIQLFRSGLDWFSFEDLSPVDIHVVVVLAIASLSVIFAVFSTSRLSAILAMGVLGYSIALLYMFYGAIDLAITQFLAETILMVIFVMVIYYLPRFAVLSSPGSRIRDSIIATGSGVMIVMVVLRARFINLEEPVSRFFAENSLSQGHGKNIVNVTLVDFRALDTLGEIAVLALAAAGVFALLRLDIKNKKK